MKNGFLKKFYIRDLRRHLIDRHFELTEIEKDGTKLTLIKKLITDFDKIKTYDIVGLTAQIFPSGRVILGFMYANPDIEYIVHQILYNEEIDINKILISEHQILHCGTICDEHAMRHIVHSCFYDIEKGTFKTLPEWLRFNYDENEIPPEVESELNTMINVSVDECIQSIRDIISKDQKDRSKTIFFNSKDDINGATYSQNDTPSGSKIVQFPNSNNNT